MVLVTNNKHKVTPLRTVSMHKRFVVHNRQNTNPCAAKSLSDMHHYLLVAVVAEVVIVLL